MPSSAEKRRDRIIEELSHHVMVRVADLSERFGVSEVSIRRDLSSLERIGLLKRVHGGAVAASQGAHMSTRPEIGHPYSVEKERIGRVAAGMISDGERIIFDSGSTVLRVANNLSDDLLDHGNLTVITAALSIVRALGSRKGVHLLLLGGVYLPTHDLVAGPQAINNLKSLHADKMFLGTDGMTFAHGLTTANVLEAEVDKSMVEAASEIIVVADSSKIGVVGLTTIVPLSRIDKLVTDVNAPSDFVAGLMEQGVEVILA